jgi:hypothetical protein
MDHPRRGPKLGLFRNGREPVEPRPEFPVIENADGNYRGAYSADGAHRCDGDRLR